MHTYAIQNISRMVIYLMWLDHVSTYQTLIWICKIIIYFSYGNLAL